MKRKYRTKDIMKETGLSATSIINKIKSGEFRPENNNYYKDGGYIFNEEEYQRIVEKYAPPGLTTSQIKKELGLETHQVYQLFEEKKLTKITRKRGRSYRYYAPKEEVKALKQELKLKQTHKYRLLNEGYFILQPFEKNGDKARIIDLSDGGKLLTRHEQVLSIAEAKYIGFRPLLEMDQKGYIAKDGWVRFTFPKPKFIDSPVYELIDQFYVHAGVRNVKVELDNSEIRVELKPCLLKGMNNIDDFQLIQNHIKEGFAYQHSDGILLKSEYEDIRISLHTQKKRILEKIVKEENYESLKALILEAIDEKIENIK